MIFKNLGSFEARLIEPKRTIGSVNFVAHQFIGGL